MTLGQSEEGCSARQIELIRQLLLQGYVVKIGETGLTIYRLGGVNAAQSLGSGVQWWNADTDEHQSELPGSERVESVPGQDETIAETTSGSTFNHDERGD